MEFRSGFHFAEVNQCYITLLSYCLYGVSDLASGNGQLYCKENMYKCIKVPADSLYVHSYSC